MSSPSNQLRVETNVRIPFAGCTSRLVRCPPVPTNQFLFCTLRADSNKFAGTIIINNYDLHQYFRERARQIMVLSRGEERPHRSRLMANLSVGNELVCTVCIAHGAVFCLMTADGRLCNRPCALLRFSVICFIGFCNGSSSIHHQTSPYSKVATLLTASGMGYRFTWTSVRHCLTDCLIDASITSYK